MHSVAIPCNPMQSEGLNPREGTHHETLIRMAIKSHQESSRLASTPFTRPKLDGNQVIKSRERTHHKPRIGIVLACARGVPCT